MHALAPLPPPAVCHPKLPMPAPTGGRASVRAAPLDATHSTRVVQHCSFRPLHISLFRASPRQARKKFDEGGIQRLARSLREHGTLQPIVVRPAAGGGYEVVAGERRLRAARLAGIQEIPAAIRDIPDGEMLELALIENLQRVDLNPVEKARAYRRLACEYGLSHEEIARRMGEDRRTVSHTIQLLELGEEALALLESGQLGSWHGKALLAVKDRRDQTELARQAAQRGWSVRRLQAAIRDHFKPRSARTIALPSAATDLQALLASVLKAPVTIRQGRLNGSGAIRIDYRDQPGFERIASHLTRALEALK